MGDRESETLGERRHRLRRPQALVGARKELNKGAGPLPAVGREGVNILDALRGETVRQPGFGWLLGVPDQHDSLIGLGCDIGVSTISDEHRRCGDGRSEKRTSPHIYLHSRRSG